MLLKRPEGIRDYTATALLGIHGQKTYNQCPNPAYSAKCSEATELVLVRTRPQLLDIFGTGH